MKRLSTELQLLFEVSQNSPSQNQITILLAQGLDENHLFALALANGVLPLLYKELTATQKASLSHIFKNEVDNIKTRNFHMSALLLRLLFLLHEKKIEIIPFKGPILAQHAYEDLALRPFSDIDILAHENDLMNIYQVLLEMGFEALESSACLEHPYILKKFSDISFVHAQSGIVFELHWQLLKNATATLKDLPSLFKNSISLPFQNMQINSLPLEEEFVYLCSHASKHRWERIEWMNDIVRLFALHQDDYDWDRLLEIAKTESYSSAYFLGLLIIEELYHQEILHPPTKTLMRTKKTRQLFNEVLRLHQESYILLEKKEGIRWREQRFALKLEDAFLKKLAVLQGIFIPLYKSDIVKGVKLPKGLEFFYYFYRWIRLFKKLFK